MVFGVAIGRNRTGVRFSGDRRQGGLVGLTGVGVWKFLEVQAVDWVILSENLLTGSREVFDIRLEYWKW